MRVALLGDIARLDFGFAFDSTAFNTDGRGLPLVRIRDVIRGRSRTYFEGLFEDRYRVNDGDYLIGMDGEFNLAQWHGGVALLNQRVCRVGVVENVVDLDYLARFLPIALADIEAKTPFVTVKHLSAKVLRGIEVPLPPLDEQRRIAAILDQADALRARRRQALAHLDDLTQSIFHDMFGARDRVTVPLGDLAGFYSGGTPSKQKAAYWLGSLPWFSAKDLKSSDLYDSQDHISARVPADTSLRLLPPNTIALVVRGMILAHTVPVSVLRIPATVNQDLKAILPSGDTDENFLAAALRGRSSWILARVSTAAHGTKKLESSVLATIPIPAATGAEQKEFSRRVTALNTQRGAVKRAVAADDNLFASLHSRAFQGEL